MNFADGQPALLERTPTGDRQGRVLLLTTPTNYQANDPWNELALSWSFVVLAEETVNYLSGRGDARFDFEAGESVEVPRRPSDPFTLYALRAPDGTVERIAVEPTDTAVTIPQVLLAGAYSLTSTGPQERFSGGFCVNVSPSESRLDPVPDAELLATFPEGRASVVRQASELQRIEGTSRIGRELFPWIMLLVTALFFTESYLANRVYRRSASTPAPISRS
jgi:hypothetical protein